MTAWDNPAMVMQTIASIEDAIALSQNAHVKAVGDEIRLGDQLKSLKKKLAGEAEGSNADERAAWVEQELEESEIGQAYIEAKAAKGEESTRFERLKSRLSACQSLLKQMQHDSTPAQFGQGRGHG